MEKSSVKLDVFKVMGDAWEILRKNFFKSIAGWLLGVAVILFFHIAMMFCKIIGLYILSHRAESNEKIFSMISALLQVAERFCFFLEIFAACWIMGGLCYYFLKLARGGCPKLSEIFILDARAFNLFISAFLIFIGTFVGFLFCIIPGIVLFLMWSQAFFLIVDRNCGPVEAMRKSVNMMKENKLKLFFILIILALIGFLLNFCTCFLAVIFIAPWKLLILSCFYSELSIDNP
ncbi:MAG: hypothetical protein A2017_09570 [Lentisphaerae bacterium GWF2_44_16]|nr:MAG: hypothetical protein A2017_09570 [Lentisphaerae bacterium GWF2_44_16]